MKVTRTLVVEGPDDLVKLELIKAKVAPGAPFVRPNGVSTTEISRTEE